MALRALTNRGIVREAAGRFWLDELKLAERSRVRAPALIAAVVPLVLLAIGLAVLMNVRRG
jgi:hypothetical protein